MNYWIRAYNHKRFRVADFIRDYGFIDWGMRNRYQVGDIMFLYATAPESRITFMMEITKVGMTAEDIAKDDAYYLSQEYYDGWVAHKHDCLYARCSFLKKISSPLLSLERLREQGLSGAPRSPRKLWPETVDYILENV